MDRPPARFGLEITLILAFVQFSLYVALGMGDQAQQFLVAVNPLLAGVIAGIQYGLFQKGENGGN